MTHMGCAQCIVHCSNEFVDKDGKYVTSSLEYETIWAMGGMTGIDDLDTIARLDFLCDDIGLETMNTGVAVAVAMDAGYKAFGDGEAAIAMVEEVARGTAFGRILGNGPAEVGGHFNNPRVPVVNGQSLAAYDPRAMQGNGVTFATSPMGADHTAGNLVGAYLTQQLDPLKEEGRLGLREKCRLPWLHLTARECALWRLQASRRRKGARPFSKGTQCQVRDRAWTGGLVCDGHPGASERKEGCMSCNCKMGRTI